MNPDYLELNRQSWNQRTATHLESDFYDNASFIAGRNSLNAIELSLLDDLKGKKVLHLQCHFGQDTISLERLGAEVTGVDLSDKAIEAARELAEKTGSAAQFVCCDIYSLPQSLEGQFDIVFTSYGTIGWLPDLDLWAEVVRHFLKPGGQFLLVEFHPFVWAFDNDFQTIAYSYFNRESIRETQTGTYADRAADIEIEYISWNHPISEVLNALLNKGLRLEAFHEYDYSPYDCFNQTLEFEPGKFCIEKFGQRLPMVYACVARG